LSYRIGALGPEGTYSEKAALLWLKGRPQASIVYFNDFEGVLEAVA
jgi:prephenate dehydratase